MKYRIRLNMDFVKKSDAQTLMDFAKGLVGKAVNTNEGEENEEISFVELRESYHDEISRSIPDKVLDKQEVKRLRII